MASDPLWNPISPRAWARALGLVHVPLFGPSQDNTHQRPPGEYAVLLDGRRSSFALCTGKDMSDLVQDQAPLSWSWSANLPRTFIVNERSGSVLYRRWDAPREVRRFPLPRTWVEAVELFHEAENPHNSQPASVIARMLAAFRQVRAALAVRDTNAATAARVFNAFLVGTEKVRAEQINDGDWRNCRTIGEAMDCLDKSDFDGVPDSVRPVEIGDILSDFLDSDPHTGCWLAPDLLIRHASGVLYQEAHFDLERSQPALFPGMAPLVYKGTSQRDARFTDAALARALVQQAFDASSDFTSKASSLLILDPACGSGVFLLEAIRELESRDYQGGATLTGYDTSEVSCVFASFCLKHAERDVKPGLNLRWQVQQRDALQTDWGKPNFVLTNPPFGAWKKMSAPDREIVRKALGDVFEGHTDKSMAFVWRAMQSLQPGGAVASIVPSPALESTAGEKWRKALADQAMIRLIGRFTGFAFFQGATVEPGFIVLKKKGAETASREPVTVVLAGEGAEDDSLRLLRLQADALHLIAKNLDLEVYLTAPETITSASWMPRSQRYLALIDRLEAASVSRVGDLFDVHQGTITGNNRVFILSAADWHNLPSTEREYFRPAAGTPTLRGCQLSQEQFVFYPYGRTAIADETALKAKVPTYYERWLMPHQPILRGRSRRTEDNWWQLAEARSWQHEPCKKLVSEYFGDIGSFAYDAEGEYIVLQGYGWLWRRGNADSSADMPEASPDDPESTPPPLPFHRSPLPWAYLAILNSSPFEFLLAHFCPRVQGGQFNLSARFINKVFLPDLEDETQVPGDHVRKLEMMGRQLSLGRFVDSDSLSQAAARVYGAPPEMMRSE
jgi:adenine-specific DNA-methyltransferase